MRAITVFAAVCAACVMLSGCVVGAVAGAGVAVVGTTVGVAAKGVGMAAHGVGMGVRAVTGSGDKKDEKPEAS